MEQRAEPEILKYFAYGHLPPRLKEVSKPYCEMAGAMACILPDCEEKNVALRKLLESKDAAVRAALEMNYTTPRNP